MKRAAPGTDLLQDLQRVCAPGTLLTDPASRRVYSRDASHLTGGQPLAVALPATAAELADIVRFCAARGIAITPRGTGTGLSGGAVPQDGALVLGTGRLRERGGIDATYRRVRVEAGVLNDDVARTRSPEPASLHFAPDPSSQSASTIGGNIANNAGGPHCLRHGVTLQHVLRLEWVDARGRACTSGRGLAAERGFDLGPLLCGSEGTLGLVTAADLRLVPVPERAATLAAFFPSLDRATGAVVKLLGSGLVPVAVEMVDQAMLEAIEAAFHFGFPTDVEAAMILELADAEDIVHLDAERAQELLRLEGAREVRVARDEAERAELWKCRKKAFGAVGRLTPSYVTMDVVVPPGRLPRLVRQIQEIRARHGVDISTAFHAGDGNLHPGVHYDDRDEDLKRRAHAAADEIMHAALAHGGSVSGEHGVGLEKLHAAPWQLDPVALEVMHGIRAAFDPDQRLNPGKALPPPAVQAGPDAALTVPAAAPEGIRFDWESMTVTAADAVRVLDLQHLAMERGLWLPVGLPAPETTVGEWVDHLLLRPTALAAVTIRDILLESWSELPDGRMLHAGAPVQKNVVGYGLPQFLCGGGGVASRNRGATFQLKTAPTHVAIGRCEWTNAEDIQDRLAKLAQDLAGLDTARGGATLVVEKDELGARLLALVPGRDEPRPLRQTLERGCRAGGDSPEWEVLSLEDPRRVGRILPTWFSDAGDWTVLAALPGSGGPFLHAVSGARRWVWQANPGLWWTPDPAAAPAGFHADVCLRDGHPTPLPEPDAGVPRDLLKAILASFDPQGLATRPAAWGETPDV